MAECAKRYTDRIRFKKPLCIDCFYILTEKSDEEFWEYEWLKHGTCAAIDELNSPVKYFNRALDWLKQYNMTEILAKSNIIPDNKKSYELLDIHTAVKSVLNKNPSINCYMNRETDSQYLNEIRICLKHQILARFEVIDCDGIDKRTSKDNVNTNCVNKPINYRVDFLDHTSSGWFTFFTYFSLFLFAIFIILLIKNRDKIRKKFQNTEFTHLVNNVNE